MIPRPGKPLNDTASQRPIFLLQFENLLLKRLNPVLEEIQLLPSHPFGFREKDSTIEKIHRITNITEETLESKQIRSSLFLDLAQAFD